MTRHEVTLRFPGDHQRPDPSWFPKSNKALRIWFGYSTLVRVDGHWWRRRLREPSLYRRIGVSRDDVPIVVTAAELAEMAERGQA